MTASSPIRDLLVVERHTALDRAALALDAASDGIAIRATPFVLRDPKLIPPRQWLYGRHFIRKFVSTTLAPGGVGKSSLTVVEALAMVTGRPLLGVLPDARYRAWMWNGEDPLEEIERRIAAACLRYGIQRDEIDGRLFVNSGRDTEIIIARQMRDGITVAEPAVEQIMQTIEEHGIDAVIIDPFVSSHQVTENDNNAIDRVVKTWAKIADQTRCAIDLVHHVRKTQPGAEITIEDGRGAVALTNASRSARVLNPMSKDIAARMRIEDRRRYFRTDNGKASMAPPANDGKGDWFRMASVDLGNGGAGPGDSVGVVAKWSPPDIPQGFSEEEMTAAITAIGGGKWRFHYQAPDWVGHPIARALGVDTSVRGGRDRIKALVAALVAEKRAIVVERKDAKGKLKDFVELVSSA